MTVFDTIYRQNRWAGVESRSGPGSGTAATEQVARDIVALVEELGITSVLDVGCGDGFWMPDLPGYLGVDVSRRAVQRAHSLHPDRRYAVIHDGWAMTTADLVILRDAMQHMTLADGMATLDAIYATGSRWLLASTFVGGENIDIATGDSYSPDLTALPFVLGQPDRLIFDGYGYEDGTAIRDPRKHLGLWRLT